MKYNFTRKSIVKGALQKYIILLWTKVLYRYKVSLVPKSRLLLTSLLDGSHVGTGTVTAWTSSPTLKNEIKNL